MEPRLLSATSIEGLDVVNEAGENIGEIKDLMIELKTGNVAYAVLSFGGFLGFGEKLFAIPVEAFHFDSDNHDTVTLNISKDKLEDAPGFDKDNWPQHADYDFIDSVHVYYGYEPYSNKYTSV